MSAKAHATSSDRAPASGPRASRRPRRKRKAERKKAARSSERPRSERATARAEPRAAVVAPRAASPRADGELDFELQFFDSVRPLAPAPLEVDPHLLPLTRSELDRRLRFRRRVVRLLAGLGAFGAVVTAIRVAALL